MVREGRVWIFGDNVDTDLIIPARFLNNSDPDELAKHCFFDLRPEFSKQVKYGDIIIAGSNFGCGSSREHAPISIKSAGISGIIAKSFARIFYRNSINIGLPLLESDAIQEMIEEGVRVRVDFLKGKIEDLNTGTIYHARPMDTFLSEIVQAGGLVSYIHKSWDVLN